MFLMVPDWILMVFLMFLMVSWWFPDEFLMDSLWFLTGS